MVCAGTQCRNRDCPMIFIADYLLLDMVVWCTENLGIENGCWSVHFVQDPCGWYLVFTRPEQLHRAQAQLTWMILQDNPHGL